MAGDLRLDHRDALAEQIGEAASGTDDDAAVFLKAWRKWGHNCLPKVEGDFAIAIWDSAARRLLLARDALGHRPLHFRMLSWGIAFASTAAPLACLGGQPRADLQRLAALLTFVPELGSRTFLEGIERVIPGHVLIVSADGRIDHHRWWVPRLHPVRLSYKDAVDAMRAEVERAVAAALVSDSPVLAAQLSGGHDSSLVVATASRLIGTGKTLVAITGDGSGEKADIPADSFDEAEVAAETAAMLPNVTHLFAVGPPESPLAAVDRWLPTDQAILNPYNLGWLDRTYAKARQAGARVMLVGATGNFTISYAGADRFALLAREFRWKTLLREMKAHRRRYRASWPGLLAMAVGPWVPNRLWTRLARLRGRTVHRFDERAFVHSSNGRVRAAMRFARKTGLMTAAVPARLLGSRSRFIGLQWADYGPLNHFVRARHGIELRDPLGARRVIELSLSLGADHFYRNGQGKCLSKALLRGRVPEKVYAEDQRRGMQGADWLASALLGRQEMAEEVELIAADPELAELLDVQLMRRRLAEWPAEGWSDIDQGQIYREFLTTAICAGRWARKVRERDCALLAK